MVNISLNDTDMTAFGVHDTLGRLPSDLGVLTAKQGSLVAQQQTGLSASVGARLLVG